MRAIPGRSWSGTADVTEADTRHLERDANSRPYAQRVRIALAARLGEVGRTLSVEMPHASAPSPDSSSDAATVLLAILRRVRAFSRNEARPALWLAFSAIATVFPDEDTLAELFRRFDLHSDLEVARWMLDDGITRGAAGGRLECQLDIVAAPGVVDVDFSATNEHNTGIQRVTRHVVPFWVPRGVILVAWTGQTGIYRRLRADELARVVDWDSPRGSEREGADADRLVVPWGCPLILAEVPPSVRLPGLIGLSRHSGSPVSAIGYDTIPIASRNAVSRAETDRFARYLSVIKYMRSIAAISASAAREFQGFVDMLPAQGLTGPRVVACALPESPPGAESGPAPERIVPLVLCVGSKEPRKNQAAVLVAAEHLWREGARFELLLIGGYGPDTRDFRRWLRRLHRAGRPVSAPEGVGDRALIDAYRSARFSVFVSTHEGYGLPVVESLHYGTPVITTDYGSTAEIAAAGGCLVVDPRDDDSILEAMRSLLVDDALVAELRRQASIRPRRDWEQYATEAWDALVGSTGGTP